MNEGGSSREVRLRGAGRSDKRQHGRRREGQRGERGRPMPSGRLGLQAHQREGEKERPDIVVAMEANKPLFRKVALGGEEGKDRGW